MLAGLKVALLVLAFVLIFNLDFPVVGMILGLLDLAWIGGLFTDAYEFFAKFAGEWRLGLALGLGGVLAAAFGLLSLFSKLSFGKEESVILLERKRKNS